MTVLGLPSRGLRRLLAARWRVKLGLVLATLVVAPVLGLAVIYVLPPHRAVTFAKPVLAALSDAPGLPPDMGPVRDRSVLLAADGSELATLYDDGSRWRVALDEVSDVVVEALLAAEDDRFYEHPGIDHRAVIRAALANLRSGGTRAGGSTLTQQLVNNVYLDGARSARRRFTEAWYALELEDRLTKDAILERYLNEAYFGNGTYGIAAAAEIYFDTTADQLDLGQAATLIGIIRAPSRFNPVDDLDESRRARNRIIDRMVATGRLEPRDALHARNADMGVDHTPPPPPGEPFFVEYVRRRLLDDPRFDAAFGIDPVERERLVYGGGLVVQTTLDPRLQRLAHAAIDTHLPDPAASPLAALVAVEPSTGAIRTMAVGPHRFGRCRRERRDCPRTMVNPAAPGLGGTGREPGTAFQPFVLAAALDAGVPPGWQQRTDEADIPGCGTASRPYRPRNAALDPGVKDMREALRVGNNVYSARLAGLLGPDALITAAQELGLDGGHLPADCSVASGSGTVYPLPLTSAYATLAASGKHCEPLVVTRIELGRTDRRVEEYAPLCERRVRASVADRLTDLLQAPVVSGTGTAAQLDRPAAGTTGTTDDYGDAWFVGYVPQLAATAWLGFEPPEPMINVLGVDAVTGATVPAQLWADFMAAAVADLDEVPLPAPDPVEDTVLPDLRRRAISDVLEQFDGRFDLNIERRQVRHWRDRGIVVRQAPRQGALVPPGTLVTLFVSDGQGRRDR